MTDQVIHVGRPNIGNIDDFLAHAKKILESKWLSNNGPYVQQLEREIAKYLGVKHCIAMCNGAVALEIAVRALGMKDEVIVPSYTFVATAHALYWQGITPVFADIVPRTHNISVDSIEQMITPKTTGIVAVNLWGRAAEIEALEQLAKKHGLKLLFDSAHAFGCGYKGTPIGRFGDAEIFSFHATKFFNSFEGGAVTTNDDELATQLALMRNFGFHGFDNVIHPGTNGKMTEICAAMGLVNLASVADFVAVNKANYEAYKTALAGIRGISLIDYDENELNNYQYVVIEVGTESTLSRDQIVDKLHANGILARKYFWPGCHAMRPYRDLYPHAKLMLQNTVALAGKVIVLPTGTALPPETPARIAELIRGR